MLEKLRIVFTIPELRNKIILTLILLGVYRIGYQIRLPVLNSRSLTNSGTVESFLEKMTLFAATDLRTLTIFGLGIMPYISASIIFSCSERFGRRLKNFVRRASRNQEDQRVHPLFDGLYLRSTKLVLLANDVRSGGMQQVSAAFLDSAGNLTFGWQVTLVTVMTAGTMFLMWWVSRSTNTALATD